MPNETAQVRALVYVIVDAGPPPPSFEAVLARSESQQLTRRRVSDAPRRAGWLIAATVVLLVAVFAVGFAWSSRTHDNGVSTSPRQQSTTPGSSVPPFVSGTEQALEAVPMPSDIEDVWRAGPAALTQITPGTAPTAFSVEDTTPFALATLEPTPRSELRMAPALTFLHPGTLSIGGQGSGVQAQGIPLSEIAAGRPALFTRETFPSADQQLFVWAQIPAGAAYVTMAYDGMTWWQRPISRSSAFITPISDAIKNRPVSADDPIARFVAYDADGNIVGEADAPRR